MKFLVLPYKLRPLEENRRFSVIFHTYLTWRDISLEQMARDLKDHGLNCLVSAPATVAKLQDGKIVLDASGTEKYLDGFRKAGFPMKLLIWQGELAQAYGLAKEPYFDEEWIKAHGGHSDHQVKKSFSKEFDDMQKRLAQAVDALFKERGWPEVYYYEAGEGGCEGYWGIFVEQHILKNLQEAGVKGTTSMVGLAAIEAELPYAAVGLISCPDATPEIRKRIAQAGKAYWQYGGSGLTERVNRGFWFWKSGAEGTSTEGYQHVYGDPYDEFDGLYAYEGVVWPSPQGPVPSLRYEYIREGIDDAKYVSHLDLLIKEAMKSPKPEVKEAGQEARKVIDGIMAEIPPDSNILVQQGEPPPATLDVWRWKLADQITKLQTAMGG
jgi:hypothetical protein